MERMGPRRAGRQNGDGTGAGGTGALRAAAVAVAAVAALAGCSVTVQPKNAAATRPLSSTPSATGSASATPASTPTAPSGSATTSAPSSPTPTPSDVDHTVCTNSRAILATLRTKLASDKDSTSRTAQDYRVAGSNLRLQDTKTDNSDLSAALKAVGIAYQDVGRDVADHDSTTTDLAKVEQLSKPLATLCGGTDSDH